MTDDSPPLVPKIFLNENKNSSWNFDDLGEETQLNNTQDFFSVLKTNLEKNRYSDKNKIHSNQQSTIKIDSSDLIKRCKHFLPLLTDANKNLFSKIQSGENVKIELDSDDDDNNQERTIEMNLMFCPDIHSSSDSEDDDEQITSTSLQLKKNIKTANIIEIKSEENVNK